MMAGILLTLCAVVMGLFFFGGSSSAKGHDLDGIATANLPGDWASREAERRPTWAAFPFVKTQAWW